MLAGRFYGCRPTGGPADLHGGVCASAECQCCEHAREATGSQVAHHRSVRQGVRALFGCSAHDINACPHRPWRQKHQCAVRCRAIIYWATAAIYGEALDSHFRPYLLQGRTSEAKNDCNKKSPPLAKTTSTQCLRRATSRGQTSVSARVLALQPAHRSNIGRRLLPRHA